MRSWESAPFLAPRAFGKSGPRSPGRGNTEQMQSASKQPPNDTALKRAVRHPKRLELLGYLAGKQGGMEEDELAEALGLTPPLVKYHLGVLQSADLVAHAEDVAQETPDCYVVSYL